MLWPWSLPEERQEERATARKGGCSFSSTVVLPHANCTAFVTDLSLWGQGGTGNYVPLRDKGDHGFLLPRAAGYAERSGEPIGSHAVLTRWYTNWCRRARRRPEAFCVCSLLQDFLKWRDPDSNRGHHDFQSVYVCTALCRYFLTDGLNRRNLHAPGRRKTAVYRRMPPTLSSKLSST